MLASTPTATMARSAVSVSALPLASRAMVTPSASLVSFVTLAAVRNFTPRPSSAFWAAAEISSSSMGRMRSTASITVTSAPRER